MAYFCDKEKKKKKMFLAVWAATGAGCKEQNWWAVFQARGYWAAHTHKHPLLQSPKPTVVEL